jgi:uncharacterized membrane protein YdjX (TVP38/TMEM64 family)
MKKFLLPMVLIAGLIIFFTTDLKNTFSFARLATNYSVITAFVASNQLASWLGFLLLYAVVVALSLPAASLLTLAGGAVLGWIAIPLIIIGASAGACVVFIAAKTVFASLFAERAAGFISRLEAGFKKDAFSYLLALRLIPAAPFWVVNIVPALLGMRLLPFFIATFIGIAPGTSVYVAVGRGFDKVLARGEVPDLSTLQDPYIIAPLVALGLLSLMPVVVKRLKRAQKNG